MSLSFEIERAIQTDATVTWYRTQYTSVFLPTDGARKKTGQKVLSWSRSKPNSQSCLLLFLLTILKGEDTHR